MVSPDQAQHVLSVQRMGKKGGGGGPLVKQASQSELAPHPHTIHWMPLMTQLWMNLNLS
jgi:hypothetical protein